MTSWTLDETTLKYWTTSETGEIIFGYPQHNDEVIINDKFKYIFRVPEKTTSLIDRLKPYAEASIELLQRNYTIYTGTSGEEQFNQALRAHASNISLDEEITNHLIHNLRNPTILEQEETNDETSAYLQEANESYINLY